MNFFKKLKLKIRLKLRTMHGSNAKVIGLPKLNQKIMFIGKGKITFGNNVTVGWKQAPFQYSSYAFLEVLNSTSEIYIDDDTCINNGCSITSFAEKIHIGKNCRIGTNFMVADSDFHGLTVETRDDADSIINKPVKIGDNVFIGNNVTVLKGVTIGGGAVVGSGSIVTHDIEPNTIVAGNPARFIRNVYEGKEN